MKYEPTEENERDLRHLVAIAAGLLASGHFTALMEDDKETAFPKLEIADAAWQVLVDLKKQFPQNGE